jgi:hypothetical protein
VEVIHLIVFTIHSFYCDCDLLVLILDSKIFYEYTQGMERDKAMDSTPTVMGIDMMV